MDKICTTINDLDQRKREEKRKEKSTKILLAIFTPRLPRSSSIIAPHIPQSQFTRHSSLHSLRREDGTPSLETEEKAENGGGKVGKKRALREVLTRNKILLRRGKEVLSFYIRLYRRRSRFQNVEKWGEDRCRSGGGVGKAFALKGWRRRSRWHRDSAPSPIKMFFKQASFQPAADTEASRRLAHPLNSYAYMNTFRPINYPFLRVWGWLAVFRSWKIHTLMNAYPFSLPPSPFNPRYCNQAFSRINPLFPAQTLAEISRLEADRVDGWGVFIG